MGAHVDYPSFVGYATIIEGILLQSYTEKKKQVIRKFVMSQKVKILYVATFLYT